MLDGSPSDICHTIQLKVDDVSRLSAEEKGAEDEISDPEEGTLAGQMAMMRGGGVKRVESDEESDTDDNGKDDAADSSSDSD